MDIKKMQKERMISAMAQYVTYASCDFCPLQDVCSYCDESICETFTKDVTTMTEEVQQGNYAPLEDEEGE